ncbi:MAG: hypothetical protein ABH826_02295 [Patescibacteria group bacterium]
MSSTELHSVEEAVEQLVGKFNEAAAIKFLRSNKGDIPEFCLQVKDRYSENDSTTPILLLASIIEKLV